jgi:glutamate-5-semialdehyde dehydrogenase
MAVVPSGSSADAVDQVTDLARGARAASQALASVPAEARDAALRRIAAEVRARRPEILAANVVDVSAAVAAGVDQPLVERLKLDDKRIEKIASAIEDIAGQPNPIGQIIESRTRPDGLRIEKRRVPLGVVLFLYESRPNVTTDAAALCIKSGNAVILRGGKECLHTNRALVAAIHAGMSDGGCQMSDVGFQMSDVESAPAPTSDIIHHPSAIPPSYVPPGSVVFVDNVDRALVPAILKLDQLIDVVIPRGGESLIRAVVRESTIPVLKHFTGNCHIYVDASAVEMPEDVVNVCVNAKTSYPGGAVCNAAEKILFHAAAAPLLLPQVAAELRARGVEIRGDAGARAILPDLVPARESDWPEEYLAFRIAVKVVCSIEEAIAHINKHGSRHTDAILTTDPRAADKFIAEVDSASIMINASTRFADGGEYGLGAELGISTDKLHARGPMGAAELTTYKWIVTGRGHCR